MMKKAIKQAIGIIFLGKIFFRFLFLNKIKAHIKGQYKILELGAGRNCYLKQIDNALEITAIDIFEPAIQYAKEKKIYDNYIKGDVTKLTEYFQQKSFDVVVAFDLIEHLSKEDGLKLIENMILIAKEKIIIYTPNGFLSQPAHDNNPFQEHLSGWTHDEMKILGFKVKGCNGYKKLRGMYAKPKIKPNKLGDFISNISQIILTIIGLERFSYSILCFKNIEK